MTTKIKKNFFYFFFGSVAIGIFYMGDCLSDAVSDVSGTQQCYNIGSHEVCYFIGSEHMSDWHLAYDICKRKDSTLPIIRNADEQNALEKYLKYLQLKRPGISFVWTAGKRKNFNDWIWINGEPASDKVRPSFLSEDKDHTHVVLMVDHSNRVWDPELPCPFLCQFYGDRCFLSGRIKLTNISCVVISNFMATWFNARSDCLARGGDLAVLSDQDLQILKNYSQQLPVHSVWIGLRNMSWFWQLDSEEKQTEEINYNKWRISRYFPPGDECIHIEAFSGNWIRTDCRQKHSIICQIKGNTTTATTATTGDANACNQSTEPQSGFIGVLTFAISIAGVVLACIVFSAIVGIIAARKASSIMNPGNDVYQSMHRGLTQDYYNLQARSQPPNEAVIESSH